MTRPSCEAELEHGRPCRGFALPDRPFCWAHDPLRNGERTAARSKGGKVRALQSRQPRLDDVRGLVRFNGLIVQGVLSGRIAVDVGRTVVYALSLQRQLLEASDLERRLGDLEARLAATVPDGRLRLTERRPGRRWGGGS